MDTAYLHTMDPFAIQFTESFGIRWYGLAYLGGFVSGYLLSAWLLHKPRMKLKPELLSDFVFAVAVGCIVGGRLGYVFFYRPELLFDFRSTLPFWGVLAINEGGMASHGGIIGMIIATTWFGWRTKIGFSHLADLVIYGSTLGIFFGRIANFINGELVGRACEGKCWFPVKFPEDILSWPIYDPGKLARLGEVVQKVGVSTDQWFQWLKLGESGKINSTLHALIAKVQSGDIATQAGLAPVLTARYPSQLYAAMLEGGLIFLFLLWFWRKPRKPGVIAALFLVLYPIGRILSEQFRQPDLHLGFQLFGLTRGQWLSVIMIALSLCFLVYSLRRPSEKLGGWATP